MSPIPLPPPKRTPYVPKREYWLVCASVAPFCCEAIYGTIALSESFEKFIARNEKKRKENHTSFAVTSIVEIDKRKYTALKAFNPNNESYFELLDRDYGEIIRDEDDD